MGSLGVTSFGNFTSLFIPNQELPTENTLLNSFHYGSSASSRLNNIVRMAEVADGVIVKLPMVNAVKILFSTIESISWSEKGSKIHMIVGFHDQSLGKTTIIFPTTQKSQFPRLMNLTGTLSPTPPKSDLKTYDDLDLWTIPKSLASSSNQAPSQMEDMDLGKWIRIFVTLGSLIALGSYLLNYFS